MAPSRLLPQLFGRKPRTVLRVTGLVKAMSMAREQLTNGIPAESMEEFRQFITGTVTNVDQICKQNRISPKDLPSPSFRAYQYLKGINLQNLPVMDEARVSTPTLRISNLTAAGRHIQHRLMEAALAEYRQTLGARKQIRTVQTLIQQQASYLQLVLQKKNAALEDMPARSGQVARWLFYLNDNDHFMTAIEQLAHCCRIYETLRLKARSGKKVPLLEQMYFEFSPMAALYRWQIKDGQGSLSMHPGFVSADPKVIEAILSSAILRRSTKHSLLIRQTSGSADFLVISKYMDGLVNVEEAVGQYYDLNELFHKVNQHYFKNHCQPPKLKWTTRFTRRKYGMYLPSTDTVVVSLSLDHPTVPRYVVEFIVYHELLHKILGMKETAKRQIAHTTEFRRRERLFEHYEEAQQYLESLAHSH